MHGVTTAIVGFIFAGVIWPHLVKHKVQFYAALITVVCIILLDSVGNAFFAPPPKVFYGINGLLQVAALVLCILSSGLTFGELRGEVFQTIEVVRRGGEKETIIVPLRGEQPKPRKRGGGGAAGGAGGGAAASAYDLDAARDIEAEEAALDAQERAAAAAAAAAAGGAATGASAAAPPAPAAPVARNPDVDRSIPLEP